MDTVFVILVLLIVVALLVSIGYFFVREAGPENAQQWLATPRQLRDSIVAVVTRPTSARPIDGNEPGVKLEPGPIRRFSGRLGSGSSMALEVSVLNELKDEIHDELRHAMGVTRDVDARLNRMETALIEVSRAPEEVSRSIRERDERQQHELERLQQELGMIRLTVGTYAQRRGEAVADVYAHLARVEVALAAVINPMLLPGESLALPTELLPEALSWNTWSDVGERAFAFGNAFNQNRFVLDESVATQIEAFIVRLRQVLTRDVYPAVRDGNPTSFQIAQMRGGLNAIVQDLPNVRRLLESAYRTGSEAASALAASTTAASAPSESATTTSPEVSNGARPTSESDVVTDTVPLAEHGQGA